jgi:hypothetical protein
VAGGRVGARALRTSDRGFTDCLTSRTQKVCKALCRTGRKGETAMINEMWLQVARQIADNVYATVNTKEMVGTNDETGYLLMFFNAKHHDGKATVVTSETDVAKLKKLLINTLNEIDGPRAFVIEPETMQ